MQTTPILRLPAGTQPPLETLGENRALSEPEKIAQLSRAFEAILLRHVLENGQKPMVRSTFNPDSASASIYRDMVTNQLAESISQSGTVGIAAVLERQLQRQTPADAPAPNAAAPHRGNQVHAHERTVK